MIGTTLGLVWVPCAGPALGLALALVREQPGTMALGALAAYALGTAVPLLLVGYGGQYAMRSVRSLTPYTGTIKKLAGIMMILTAAGLYFGVFERVQVWVTENTGIGNFGSGIEQSLVEGDSGTSSSALSSSSDSSSSDLMTLPKLPRIIRASEFTGLGPWHNSEPFTLASLKGKVVLIDFWTYSCINCIRTLPYLRGYWEKYGLARLTTGESAFVLLGVHTPEFTFEKSESNVAKAIKNHGLTYPIAQDNNFGTWSAFANRYWPAKYLIDAEGVIRYTHFGEGDYEETDAAIASLLKEIGVDAAAPVEPLSAALRQGAVSPEIYVGSRSWPAFGNSLGDPTHEVIMYKNLSDPILNKYYLSGLWQLTADNEAQVLISGSGEIRMKFRGGEINLVLGLAEGEKPVSADVYIDGEMTKTITIDRHDLYQLYKGEYGEHDMMLKLKSGGVEAFAFTFGQ